MVSGSGSRVNKDPESLLRLGLPIPSKDKEVRYLFTFDLISFHLIQWTLACLDILQHGGGVLGGEMSDGDSSTGTSSSMVHGGGGRCHKTSFEIDKSTYGKDVPGRPSRICDFEKHFRRVIREL